MFLLTEDETELRFRHYLKENGYDVDDRTSFFGVDIVARKSGQSYYFEVEGNKNPYEQPLTSRNKYTHLLRGLGHICLRMGDDTKGNYALVLPEDKYYMEKLNKLYYAVKKLGLDIWILEENGNISKLEYEIASGV